MKLLLTLLSTAALGTLLCSTPAFAQDDAPAATKKPASAKKPATGSAGAKKSSAAGISTDDEKTSYAIGINIGQTIRQQGLNLDEMKKNGISLDAALIARGVADAIGGSDPALSAEELQAAMQSMQTKMQARFEAEAAATKKKGEEMAGANAKFLADNAKKEGVKTTKSGLQYKVIKSGKGGAKPKPTDVVSANYEGRLIDGTVFDASPEGEPVQFPVNRVIQGWQEAVQLMSVGDKWQLYIPGDLAYGENAPPGGKIYPGATLVFDIELVKVDSPTGPGRPGRPAPSAEATDEGAAEEGATSEGAAEELPQE